MDLDKMGGRKFVAFMACYVAVVISHFVGKDAVALAMALGGLLGLYYTGNLTQKIKVDSKGVVDGRQI